MTNKNTGKGFSNLQKSNFAIIASFLLGLAVLATGVMARDWTQAALGLAVTLIAAVGIQALRRATTSIVKAVYVAERAASGDLNARILGINGSGPISELMHNINRLMDQTEVFTRESSAAMQMGRRWQIFSPHSVDRKPWQFPDAIQVFQQGPRGHGRKNPHVCRRCQ